MIREAPGVSFRGQWEPLVPCFPFIVESSQIAKNGFETGASLLFCRLGLCPQSVIGAQVSSSGDATQRADVSIGHRWNFI